MSRERISRNIVKRIIVDGVLVLDTPTCLSDGDALGATDMMLLRDSISDKALLTGSSIAGALRNYLHEYECSYERIETRSNMSAKLFGDLFAYKDERNLSEQRKIKLREEDTQSPLIINESISSKVPRVELRDGVKIDGKTGTALDKNKYDLELLSAGTQFPLRFELLIESDKDEVLLKQALSIVLEGLKKGEIGIGMKKRRGFGKCHVEEWQIWEFDLTKKSDCIAWLTFERWGTQPHSSKQLQNVKIEQIDRRNRLFITANFKLVTPLLIRSNQNLIPNKCSPDTVHLHSYRKGGNKPVVSGASIAGVLWHRAERIIKTLDKDLKIVNELFGFVDEETKEAKASRLLVDETIIENTSELVQSRIAIDRFTGGAYHGALFQEQPIYPAQVKEDDKKKDKNKYKKNPDESRKDMNISLQIELQNPKEYEIGLLLLLLKDLWVSDLPIGGTTSIGRGRLQGLEARIVWYNSNYGSLEEKRSISENKGKLIISDQDKQRLEYFVEKLVEQV
ncbi:hypothetical protein DSM106972_063410 [Dulcicalothrix desertica PCC 7102]|uniref:CRISPR type III-associated protein domain-containing protein n=1 Tax=Dulcicalothrix desertica PCC 7102 TaxID=232991 RepID=A0A3S1CF95_9CYAN|nr:RAMP superfamily CRISPR-associated protein [Dulcicalothrix desertica]RUT02266.1 hypothetical protein DSM106972_063410 [Dulcicalothrix desertica PCC 7102]TWH53904.1 CRISPR/Cas system CSM-associated protein Csm3 (group 7 of RAMP superfamily) [Dulcicalothrix desertica PCC 7102]